MAGGTGRVGKRPARGRYGISHIPTKPVICYYCLFMADTPVHGNLRGTNDGKATKRSRGRSARPDLFWTGRGMPQPDENIVGHERSRYVGLYR